MPHVSIIMNCYNSAKDLAQAIESVLAQSEQDFELIFYDNASTDESPTIVKSFAKRLGQKLNYIRADTTVPLGCARNYALHHAKAPYIAFLDCDDLWRPTKLQKQLACITKDPKIGLVTTDTLFLQGKTVGRTLFSKTKPARGFVFSELMMRQWISMSSVLIRREALDSIDTEVSQTYFDPNLQVCEEADVFYRIAHDWKLDYIDEPLTVWRIHGENTTFQKFGAFADETLHILDKLTKLYPDFATNNKELIQLLTQRAHFQKAVDLWKNGRGSQAREILKTLPKTKKHRLFYCASYLPKSTFTFLAKWYFALPAKFRV